MKTLIFLSILILLISFSKAQTSSNFNKDLFTDSIAKIDSALASKLNSFFNLGYEKTLNIDSITPEDLITVAQTYLGTAHCMGGTTKTCIDCSGLLFAVFNELGISTPHGSEEMARYGTIIQDTANLQRGDLVFFIKSYQTSKVITHSGFYMGDGMFIHTSAKNGVEEINFFQSKYWSEKFIFGTRIF